MIRVLAICATLSACSVFTPVQPPARIVCPAVAMAKCDTTNPVIGAELSADGAADLAVYFRAQRNECSALNDAKRDCIDGAKKGKR